MMFDMVDQEKGTDFWWLDDLEFFLKLDNMVMLMISPKLEDDKIILENIFVPDTELMNKEELFAEMNDHEEKIKDEDQIAITVDKSEDVMNSPPAITMDKSEDVLSNSPDKTMETIERPRRKRTKKVLIVEIVEI